MHDLDDLRPYQVEAIGALREGLRRGHRRQILCAPTGSGKTHIAGRLIRDAVRDRGSKCVFIADRIPLVRQTSQRFYEMGIDHGVMQADQSFGRYQDVQVCSVQTIMRRESIPEADFVVIDEAHVVWKKAIQFILATDKPTIGLTATPFTKGLGSIYSNVVNVVTTNDLLEEVDPATAKPYLAPLRPYEAVEMDMSGAKTNSSGEWTDGVASERLTPLVGDVPSTWVSKTRQVFGGPVKTLVFSPTVADGARLVQAFQSAGYDFRQSTYRDSAEKTDALVRGFADGKFTGLVSVDKFVKGFDVPDVKCIVMARPYRRSLASVIQTLGRGMRAARGKDFCLVLDHAGNMRGHREAIVEFYAEGCIDLDAGDRRKPRVETTAEEREQTTCKCGYIFIDPTELNCPACGADRPQKRPSAVETARPGGMVAVDLSTAGEARREALEWADDRNWTWRHMCAGAREIKRHQIERDGDHEPARKLAAAQYHSLYGDWPADSYDRTVQFADRRVLGKMRRQLRRYFKSKERKR